MPEEKWTEEVTYPFVEQKLLSSIQVSSTVLYISPVRTPGIEFSICEVYVKNWRGVYFKLAMCSWFVCLSPHIHRFYFKIASFSVMLNPFGVRVWRYFIYLSLYVSYMYTHIHMLQKKLAVQPTIFIR